MAIQIETNKIKSNSIIKIAQSQVVVKANLDTTSDSGTILGTVADARAVAIEPMQGEVQVSGKVNFKTMLLGADNEVISLDYYADFIDTIKESTITASSKLLLELNVIDTDSSIDGKDIVLSAVVEIGIKGVVEKEYPAIVSTDENIFTKQDKIITQEYIGITEGAFELYEEIETSVEIDKILIYDTQIIMTSIKSGTDILTISGEVYASITYLSQELIQTKNVAIPFSEELDAQGANENSIIIPSLFIKSKRIVLSGSKGENLIRAELVVGLKAPILGLTETNAIADIYSNKIMLEVETEDIDSIELVKEYTMREKINATASLDKGMPAVKSIITCCLNRNNIANLIAGDNEIVVEGLMTACILYLDENDKPTSVRAELPYSLKLPADGIAKNDLLSGSGVVFNVVAQANNKEEIDVTSDIKLNITSVKSKKYSIISNVIEGEELITKQNAISIYIATGGEEMWDIVKTLSVLPDEIQAQNPELQLPLEAGDKVRVYRVI